MRTRYLTLVGACFALIVAGCGGGSSSPSSDPDAAGSAPTSFSPGPNDLMLGPDGVLDLRLGMTAKELAKTGQATSEVGSSHEFLDGCSVVFFDRSQLGVNPDGHRNGMLSTRQGLEEIHATERMVLPNGIRLGSSLDFVRKVLDRPALASGAGIKLPASDGAILRIQMDGTVVDIALELRDLTCVS